MLGRFGFDFSSRANIGHQRQMNINHVFFADIGSKLPDGLQKWQTFNVTDRAANFNNEHINIVGGQLNTVFDFICDVRDDLHGSAQVIPFTLFGNNGMIYFPGGKVIDFAHFGMGETLIVTQVKIGFGSIIGHKHLAMLKGIHRSRIHIYIGIQFLDGHC